MVGAIVGIGFVLASLIGFGSLLVWQLPLPPGLADESVRTRTPWSVPPEPVRVALPVAVALAPPAATAAMAVSAAIGPVHVRVVGDLQSVGGVTLQARRDDLVLAFAGGGAADPWPIELPVGTWAIRVVAGSGLVSGWATIQVNPHAAEVVSLRLRARWRLHGTVTDGRGVPLPFFPITMRREDGQGVADVVVRTSAADGTFLLDTTGPGTWSLQPGAPDRPEGRVAFGQAAQCDQPAIRLVVVAPADLQMRLWTGEGTAPEHTVVVLRHADLPLQERRAIGDAHGVVRFRGLPLGAWLLTVQCAHGGCCDHPLSIHGGDNIEDVRLLPDQGPVARAAATSSARSVTPAMGSAVR